MQEAQVIKIENKVLLGVFALEAFNDVMVEVMKARMKHKGIIPHRYRYRLPMAVSTTLKLFP